jgi:hypothetical protein
MTHSASKKKRRVVRAMVPWVVCGFLILLSPCSLFAQVTNQPPVANDDSAATEQNVSVPLNVVSNDSDPDPAGTPEGTLNLPGITFTSPANGTVAYDGNGMFTYTPNAGFGGTDSFQYTICDSAAAPLCDTAFVFVEIALVETEVTFSVIPPKLNVKKRGVLPVVIFGTADFDVRTIDPVSIRLEGVAPLRSNINDAGTPEAEETPDGIRDLEFKFSAPEIVAAIGDVYEGNIVVLHLTGTLKGDAGGNPIIGEDTVEIIGAKIKPPKPPKPPKHPKK